jgi:hypothetical protein
MLALDDSAFARLCIGAMTITTCSPTAPSRIFFSNASPVGTPWMWMLAAGQHEDRTPTHGLC